MVGILDKVDMGFLASWALVGKGKVAWVPLDDEGKVVVVDVVVVVVLFPLALPLVVVVAVVVRVVVIAMVDLLVVGVQYL